MEVIQISVYYAQKDMKLTLIFVHNVYGNYNSRNVFKNVFKIVSKKINYVLIVIRHVKLVMVETRISVLHVSNFTD